MKRPRVETYFQRNVVIATLTLASPFLLSASCKQNFDPEPYLRSTENVRSANEQLNDYETRWTEQLRGFVRSQEVELNRLAESLFLNKAYQRLSLDKLPVTEVEQDIYFPIEGNRTLARKDYNDSVNAHINSHSIEVNITTNSVAKTLIEVRSGKITEQFQLTVPQEEFYRVGIEKLEALLLNLPVFEQRRSAFADVDQILVNHRDFVIALGNSHTQLEEELISGLQSAASAIQNNAWLIRIGNASIGALLKVFPDNSEPAVVVPPQSGEDGR